MRFFGFFLLFYLFAELFSIIYLAQEIGFLWTLLWLIASFSLGSFMLRNVGFANVLVLGGLWKNKKLSFYQAMWPVRYSLAALLFMIPGLVSDVIALLLMIPFKGPESTQQNFTFGDRSAQQQQDGDIIEGEFREVSPQERSAQEPTPPNRSLPKD